MAVMSQKSPMREDEGVECMCMGRGRMCIYRRGGVCVMGRGRMCVYRRGGVCVHGEREDVRIQKGWSVCAWGEGDREDECIQKGWSVHAWGEGG